MQTFHIHIKGIVQGVGFRPYVCRVAESMNLSGCVSNTNNGVHIAINADDEKAKSFYHHIIQNPPVNAIITAHNIEEIEKKKYSGFSIIHSITNTEPDLLLTPDIAICDVCREEIKDPANRRHNYAFTTCLNCGPRYSIQTLLPYDRNNTTMHDLHMCAVCEREYHDIHDRRHYSQTNSCPDCEIRMHYHSQQEADGMRQAAGSSEELVNQVADDILSGMIVAVKGVGGYLLLCDASNEETIKTLRVRKQRPAKPLALMYPSIEAVETDLEPGSSETHALKSKAAPIVLCKIRDKATICIEQIAPGLDKIGAMLPASPLLELIAMAVGKPVVATSGNISGSPIIYKDEDALTNLFEVADRLLTYDREIVAPQDDTVIQFTETGKQIILRRSRGLAPNYFPSPFQDNKENILALGGELKSAFAIQQKNNLYVSQYLGDQGSLESQESFSRTLNHLEHMLHFEPTVVMVDKHPAYNVSSFGRKMAAGQNKKIVEVQHHEAHFSAVLAENELLNSEEKIMGFIWDGTGYGDDGQVWGGETFMFQDGRIERKLHLKYFPQILGDKMSREPRLSALSLLHDMPEFQGVIYDQFTKSEWDLYQKILKQEQKLQTSSMGRFLDGVSAILGLCTHNSYEGEAAMKLEAIARRSRHHSSFNYPMPVIGDCIDTGLFVEELMADVLHGYNRSWIAGKIFNSLAILIDELSDRYEVRNIAFSGGVFQNALLTDMIEKLMGKRKNLYFHRQLSPNDESIGFGQLAMYHLTATETKSSLNPSYVFSHSR